LERLPTRIEELEQRQQELHALATDPAFYNRMRWLLLGDWGSYGLWRRNRKRLMDSGRIWWRAPPVDMYLR
jgi:hypothetical protein